MIGGGLLKDIVIRGSGGLAREVALLIERINSVTPTWNLLGYVDNWDIGQVKYGYKVLGNNDILKELGTINCVVAIADPLIREKVVNELAGYNLSYPTLIDPSVIMGKDVVYGKGCIVLWWCDLTVDVKMGDYCFINGRSTVGHNVRMGNFCSINPSCNISGWVEIGDHSFVGVGATILEKKKIGKRVTIGAGSLVINNVKDDTTVFGVPATRI